MNRTRKLPLGARLRRSPSSSVVAVLAVLGTAALASCGSDSDSEVDAGAQTAGTGASPTFNDPRTIDNRYLPLTARKRCEQRRKAEDGTRKRSVLTVLSRTKRFDVDGQAVDAVAIRDNAFEDVPGITTESNRVEEAGLRVKMGGRLLTDVIRIQEFIQPEGEIEYKLYAPGVGKVVEYAPDGRSELAGCR